MKKLIFILSLCTLATFAMKGPGEEYPHRDLIAYQGIQNCNASPALIKFQKAKVRAFAHHLLRMVPNLQTDASDIYTKDDVSNIIARSFELFGGSESTQPVPGYLEILENLETSIHNSPNVHPLSGRLYELERALALADNGHRIIEFGPKIKIPEAERTQIHKSKAGPVYLLSDVDIYAQDKDGKAIYEEVKSFQFCSTKGKRELSALLTGMKVLKQRYGIECRMHTKFAPFPSLSAQAKDKNVALGHDSDQQMQQPNKKPVYQNTVSPYLIDPARIKIDRSECVVCYDEITPDCMQLTRDLEHAHVEYLKNGLVANPEAKDSRKYIHPFLKARKRFSCIPGFLKHILTPCVARMQEEKWGDLKSTVFEVTSALDIPAHTKIIAFGAELFYDMAHPNTPKNVPSYKKQPEGYLIQKGANTGLDLDVLLQNTNDPAQYSFIEATTGPSSVKPFKKFEPMGRAIDAEVFVLHDFDGKKFERTAYAKRPIKVVLSPAHNIMLPWQTARRTNTCLQQITQNKNMYDQVIVEIHSDELFYDFNTIYNQIRDAYMAHNGLFISVQLFPDQTRKITEYVFEDLESNINRIFKMLGEVSRHASEDVYRFRIADGIEQVLNDEKETGRIGSLAFAILFLNKLECTIENQNLLIRFVPTVDQYSFDVDGILKDALELAIKRLSTKAAC